MGLAISVFVAARFWGLTVHCLWFDEIFSVHAAEHNWRSIFHFVAADIIHPPFFYVALKLWISIGGESVLWLRLFSVIISVAAIAPFLRLTQELKLTAPQERFALFLLATNGYLIKYAQEVRMYSLLFLLSVFSLWLFVSIFMREHVSRGRFVALTAINLLMIYTHYYGWIIVALQLFASVRYRKEVKAFILSCEVLFLAYFPWFIEIARGYHSELVTQNIGWIARPGLRAIGEYVTLLNQPFLFTQTSAESTVNVFTLLLIVIIFGVPLFAFTAFWFGQLRHDGRFRPLFLLVMFAFVPALLVGALSWILPHSIWGTRHLIIAIAPYCVVATIAISRLRPYWARVTVSLIFGCWVLLAAGYALMMPAPNFSWCTWTPLAQQLKQVKPASSNPITVYAFEDLVAYHLWFALRDSRANYEVAVMKDSTGVKEDPAYFLPREFSDISTPGPGQPTDPEIWIAFRAPGLDETQPPLRYFHDRGYQTSRVLTMHAQNEDAFLIQLHRK